MAARELYLLQLPVGLPASEINKIKTVEELDKVCSRFTDTIEEDLKKRLFVYREDREKWYAQPKFKRIYKYIPPSKADKKVERKQESNRRLRTLKKKE